MSDVDQDKGLLTYVRLIDVRALISPWFISLMYRVGITKTTTFVTVKVKSAIY